MSSRMAVAIGHESVPPSATVLPSVGQQQFESCQDGHIPTLLKKSVWTRASPFICAPYQQGTSDSVGSHYSPAAQSLSTQTMRGVAKRTSQQHPQHNARETTLSTQMDTACDDSPLQVEVEPIFCSLHHLSVEGHTRAAEPADDTSAQRLQQILQLAQRQFASDDIASLEEQTVHKIIRLLPSSMYDTFGTSDDDDDDDDDDDIIHNSGGIIRNTTNAIGSGAQTTRTADTTLRRIRQLFPDTMIQPAHNTPIAATLATHGTRSAGHTRAKYDGALTHRAVHEHDAHTYMMSSGEPTASDACRPSKLSVATVRYMITHHRLLRQAVVQVKEAHAAALRRSVVEYILLAPAQQQRLRLTMSSVRHDRTGLRFGVLPWHDRVVAARESLQNTLNATHPLSALVLDTFHAMIADPHNREHSSRVTLFDVETVRGVTPCRLSILSELIRTTHSHATAALVDQWIAPLAQAFVRREDEWQQLAAHLRGNADGAFARIDSFFCSVAVLMESLVRHSLLLPALSAMHGLFVAHSRPESFLPPLLLIQMRPVEQTIATDPSFARLTNGVLRAFDSLAASVKQLPRVETLAFSSDSHQYLFGSDPTPASDERVRAMRHDLARVLSEVAQPVQALLNAYADVRFLLTPEAGERVRQFLAESPSLELCRAEILRYRALAETVQDMPDEHRVGVVHVDFAELHARLSERALSLASDIVQSVVRVSRKENTATCSAFEELTATVGRARRTPQEIRELVEYVSRGRNETLPRLRDRIVLACERLELLMDFAVLSADDVALNGRTMRWPLRIQDILDGALLRMEGAKMKAGNELRARANEIDARLAQVREDISAFRSKDTPVERKRYLEEIEEIEQRLEEARNTVEALRGDEELLEWEPSEYGAHFDELRTLLEPHAALWSTAVHWITKQESWLRGPLCSVDVAQLEVKMDEMSRTFHRLGRVFQEQGLPGLVRAVDAHTRQLDRFKELVPLVRVLRNGALQAHHWRLMEKACGFCLTSSVGDGGDVSLPIMSAEEPTVPATSLLHYVERNIMRFLPQLQEISEQATVELER